MPEYWYDYRKAKEQDRLNAESGRGITFNAEIVADRKPYFMTYVYPKLKCDVREYVDTNAQKAQKQYFDCNQTSIQEYYDLEIKPDGLDVFLHHYEKNRTVGDNDCTINRMCKLFEREFPLYTKAKYGTKKFDSNILKSDSQYSIQEFEGISNLWEWYKEYTSNLAKQIETGYELESDDDQEESNILRHIISKAEIICPNRESLCNILIDLCYKSDNGKKFVWDIAGDTIIDNLLEKNSNSLSFPHQTNESPEFEYCGQSFKMEEVILDEQQKENNLE